MLFNQPSKAPSKILIVDDEETNIMLLKEALNDLGEIQIAYSATEAIEKATTFTPDIVVMDVDMPGMNGIQACKHIKQLPNTEYTSVVFVTSYQESEIEASAFLAGGADFISKPIDFGTCRLRVNNQLKLQEYAKTITSAKDDLDSLVKHLPVFISYWNTTWENQFSNDPTGKWLGFNSTELFGKAIETVFPDHIVNEIHQIISESDKPLYSFETSYQPPEQDTVYLNISISKSVQRDEPVGYLMTLSDITSLKRAESQLYDEKERLRITLNSIGDAVIAVDTEGIITFINPIAERMTGWHAKSALGRPIETVMNIVIEGVSESSVNPVRLALQEQRIVGMALNSKLHNQNGEEFHVEDSAAPIRDKDGVITGAIIVFHDVSEAVAMSIKMSHLANHDQLTDLPNRILLHDRLTYACKLAHYSNKKVATILIDIDHFKYINDTLGHTIGDELIRQLAYRIQEIIPESCTLARIGGDEFLLLIPNISHIEEVDEMANNITHAMHQPFEIVQQRLNVSASLGISIYPNDAATHDDLMRHSDVAMYRAKHEGRNRYCFFSDELEKQVLKRHSLQLRLREAISNNEIQVYYQPKVQLTDGKLIGFEALARLQDENGHFVSPCDFIPLAEETGQITALGFQVLEKACLQASHWQQKYDHFSVSVNVSVGQFADENFVNSVLKTLEKTGLPCSLLELEVTESALMSDNDKSYAILTDLYKRGIKVSIDDFGTGYSSLSYLKKFRVDILKIDQSFVKDMLLDVSDLDIVKTIISLANSMKLNTIAEGIETSEQRDALLSLGCQIGQGYYFSRPMPGNEVENYINTNHT